MSPLASRRLVACLALPMFFLGTVLMSAQAPDKAPIDPAEAKVRALVNGRVEFKSLIFSEDKFPAGDFGKLADFVGPHEVKTTFYNADSQAVEAPGKPGAYGAVMEVTPKEGQPFRRYFTLFRAAQPLDASWKPNIEAPEELAKVLGLDPAIVKQESKAIAAVLNGRSVQDFNNDRRAAQLFAGLLQMKPGDGPARKNADALALERQSSLALKRKLAGLDKTYPKPFVGPSLIEGKPAPEVREGTLAEAGMEPGTLDKLDAILKTWAAEDDQAFAVCVVRRGVIVIHKAYGERDGKPMTVNTKSWMASVTKAMSASLMWQLIDQGIVGLDDPIEKHIPAFRGIKVEKPLTVRHLYTHTNGLSKWPGWSDELPDVEERVAQYYPNLHVAKEFGYNGTGYMLGGKIIENISGEALPLFFQKHLLDPLGCPNTDVIGTHADAQSVPLDMAKFGQMLLNKGAYGKHRFFQEETFLKMLPTDLAETVGPSVKRKFGIGLDGSPEKFGHGAASAATFHVDRGDELVVVMTRNKMGKVQDKHNGKFWQAIRDGIEKTK